MMHLELLNFGQTIGVRRIRQSPKVFDPNECAFSVGHAAVGLGRTSDQVEVGGFCRTDALQGLGGQVCLN